jgi:ferric-dicitrate binding protein FerR (iron transport regulator)
MSEEQQLIDAYMDSELTSEDEVGLAEWLAADDEHVRQFVRETYLHRQIREVMLARPYRAYGLSEDDHAARQAKAAPVRWLGGQLGRLLGFRWPLALRASFAALAVCLMVAVAVGFWCLGPTMGEPVLAEVRGAGISLERAGQPVPTLAGTRLQAGDLLRAPEAATAIIGFAPEKTRITIQPGTDLALASMSRGKRLFLRRGKLETSVARQRPFRSMVLKTPEAEARVLGTHFTLAVATNGTRLEVTEGKVRFTRMSDLKAVRVTAGHYAVAAADCELAALPFTGAILRESWSGVAGQSLNDFRKNPRFPDHPDGSDLARSFELEPVKTNRFGVRFRGYLHPPVSGDYEFWLATATDAVMFVSPDERVADKVAIARMQDVGRPKEWDAPRFRGSSLWAPPVPLVAGQRYYIEALVFIEKGEGHLSVAWKRPGGSRELLTGEFLSPFKPK